ncbi:tRNA nucleotidyltransferase, mitochondrial precursor, putative [Candida dubliniensis CD36]|uniref:CCA tRNA nucleotidyltransferase, mitochondrial n=1 Tax=Candida dubliniensis (strain CD36 / ATCC MYA-646 / CBS 7987 / NCPF 3949 / NRRL Y-17841) TaxID=573826 RepID=B9WFG0_CANDC|nr:tRNA nucleotidyltransferase, mitochondrial precursor, putative [Candida dubliniensis CD36]CAX41979.1 tRNA nucleotidyltransferase, mitochondrial precursor, putative [Candida dubliniensis CD36]
MFRKGLLRFQHTFTHTMKRLVSNSIVLTTTEENIRNVLVGYCDYYNKTNNDSLELRITGGWVRDKLLGNESHDIDIAVNHLTGEEFVNGLHDYLRQHEPELSMNHVHTIKMNPEKSKHLETCTTKLFGVDIDFVNLRSEEYTHDSRVPSIEFGTPEQDAVRRDATLNALFYNLNQGQIEDYTKRGLSDLQNGILKTPLAPIKTFLDDPLRIIRLIRFASKFNFVVESETLNAMKEEHNKSALSTKISKERIEIELRKILTSNNPGYGLQLINYVDLASSIFYVPELAKEFDNESLEQARSQLARHIEIASLIYPNFKQTIMNSTEKFKKEFSALMANDDYKSVFWLSVILHPYTNVKSHKPNRDIFNQYLRLGLTSKKSDIAKVSAINMNSAELSRLFSAPELVKRSDIGLYLRKFPEFASLNLIVNALLDCVRNVDQFIQLPKELPVPFPEVGEKILKDENINKVISDVVSRYEKLFIQIENWDLTNVHLVKPLIDGTTLSKSFGMKPGPWLRPTIEEILVWQLDNPQSSVDECFEFVKTIIPKYK